MSKTALIDAVKDFDVKGVRRNLEKSPSLREWRSPQGFNLLQFCCARSTGGDKTAAGRQLRLAKWLVSQGFDPLVIHTTKPGEDGEADPAELSLVFFAVARAQSNALARYFLEKGAVPSALFAAAWWGNWEILADLVRHGDDINRHAGATPLHMAIAVLDRGIEGKPALAKRRLKTVTEFLRLGADPNIADDRGGTLLHLVLKKGYDPAIFRMLLKNGADPDVAGSDGRTAREIAMRKKDKRYSALLR
jgi:Ankyrin repeat